MFITLLAALLAVQEPLTVGTTSGYAPYVSLNDKGAYEGFDIDFAEALGQKLDRKVVIKDLGSMPSLLLALKQGKVDAIIWAISITPDRERNMNMVYYQGERVETTPVLFWDKSTALTLSDLKGKTVSVEASSYQEEIVKNTPGMKYKQIEKVQDGILELKYGKTSALLVDGSIVKELTKKFPELFVVEMPLPENERSKGNGVALRKDDVKLTQEVEQAILELTQDGTIENLEKKWGLK